MTVEKEQEEVLAMRNEKRTLFFNRIFTRRLKKQFHALRILNPPTEEQRKQQTIICYINHPSWNDPMVASFIHHHYFDQHAAFAPIDQQALDKYAFMKKIGLYGVDHGNAAAMRRFLRTSQAILSQAYPLTLWITAQGEFADARVRPLKLQPGLGALLARNFQSLQPLVLPVALEYTFGIEKLPEIYINFGSPVEAPDDNHIHDAKAWTQACECALQSTQDQLAETVINRDKDQCKTLLGGSTGIGGWYESWQKMKCALQGKKFDPSHASVTKTNG